MISIESKTECCGCEACANRCPLHCITMIKDNEGFLYPKVDTEKCVGCGECERICPILQQGKERKPIHSIASYNACLSIRKNSSSGGVFTQLAEYTIKQNGVVFGALFDSHWQVYHGFVDTVENLSRLRGSKYVQSRIGDSYRETKQFLKEKRQVLFSGTPCQIAGLKRFLGKEYENLLTVDVACHGVPSPGIWNSYLKELSNRLLPGSSIKSVNFRDKKFGWKNYHITIVLEKEGKQHVYSVPFYRDWYLLSFLKNLILRPSCSSCQMRNGKSGSDITIGDFWGVETICPELDDDFGTSIILVNTLKGSNIVKKINRVLKEVDYSLICVNNPCFVQSFPPHPFRDHFFHRKQRTQRVVPSMKLALDNGYYMRLKRWLILKR